MTQSVGQDLPPGVGAGPLTYAPAGRRALAFVIDNLIAVVPALPLSLLSRRREGDGFLWASITVFVVIAVWNTIVRQGLTGYSVGKQMMGLRLVSERTLAPIGPLNCYVRSVMHTIVDQTPLFAGYVYGLFDHKRQSFADKIMRTVPLVEPRPRRSDRTSTEPGSDR